MPPATKQNSSHRSKSNQRHSKCSSPQSPPSSKTTKQMAGQSTPVLFLKQALAKFEAPNKKVSVFFDECNREIISLTSIESKTNIVFQAADRDARVEFLLPVEKKILSIKLNSSTSVLAYHIGKNNIEFINVKVSLDTDGIATYQLEDRRYVQTSRAKNSKLYGFLWTGPMELVMITDISVEYYHVDAQKYRLKQVKSFNSSINWFVYQPASKDLHSSSNSADNNDQHSYSVLMTSTGSQGNSMQPYMFARNQIIKLQFFDVECYWMRSDNIKLFEHSVTIAYVYSSVRLLVLQHESLNVRSKGAQILIYTLDVESGVTSKTHTLDLDVSGRFAINILDNLIIAHDQPSKTSFIFDIIIDSTEKSDCPRHYVSLLDSRPIRALVLEDDKNVDMYSLNWVFFQPNFIIDAKMGLLSVLQLDLEATKDAIQDNALLLNFLAHRVNSEGIILSKCKEVLVNSYQAATNVTQIQSSPLADVSSTMELLSGLVISAAEIEKREPPVGDTKHSVSKTTGISKQLSGMRDNPYRKATILQEDVHREVFRQFDGMDPEFGLAHLHFVSSTLMEFIFVVRKQNKNVEFCIYEQLLQCLVNGQRYFQLVQMIRSEIFRDSKQLACLLLSLRSKYPPAAQLGIDMLHRLNCLTDLVESLNLSPNPSMLQSETTNLLSRALSQSLQIDAN